MEETEKQNDEKTTMDYEEEQGPPTENINMKWKVVSAKRPHQTDSDSDPLIMLWNNEINQDWTWMQPAMWGKMPTTPKR